MIIVAILAGIGITGYKQHAKRADIETASNALRVWGNNYEEAVDDIGYITWDDNSTAKEQVKEYLQELEDVYMNCSFDKDSLQLVSFNSDHQRGFIVNLSDHETDPWGKQYRMVYMINTASSADIKVDNVYLASPGPNSTWVEEITNDSVPLYSEGSYDDDVILSMIVREIER